MVVSYKTAAARRRQQLQEEPLKKEKYIIERLSGGKDSSGKVVAYVVYIPYWQNGERKNYNFIL